MRQIVLDTETTGLEPAQGHRIIEIGCVELVNRRPTGRTFQRYLNPDRPIDPGAQAVHGLSSAFLANQPRFIEIVEDFVAFVAGAELIIHNAPFDVGFVDHEFGRLPPPQRLLTDLCTILDTLALARQLHPGQRNSLDALCKRYGVDNSNRDLHGALLDARILADVYLLMTGGQGALTLHAQAEEGSGAGWRAPGGAMCRDPGDPRDRRGTGGPRARARFGGQSQQGEVPVPGSGTVGVCVMHVTGSTVKR